MIAVAIWLPSLRPLAEWIVDRYWLWRYPRSRYGAVPPGVRQGKWLQFILRSETVCDLPAWDVCSQRGYLHMGEITWSPQWRAYRFRSDADAMWNGGSVAEVYAFLKERGADVGRFV